MKKHILTIALLSCATWAKGQDQCSTAIPITTGAHTVGAVIGTPPALNCNGGQVAGNAIWFSYTPSSNTGITITSDLVENTGGDTRVSVFIGGCSNLSCYAWDDDGGSIGNGYLSICSFNAVAGITYYIAWDDRWSGAGFTFQLNEGPVMVPSINFTSTSNPTQGSVLAAVDMNNDQLDDIVTVQDDRIHLHIQQPGGGFVVNTILTTTVENSPSWSLCAGDLNDDGYNDLLYGGGQGVTMMLTSGDGTAFNEVSYPEYVFSQRSNMIDINNDGLLDAFVCHDVDPNVFYINNGDGTLTYNQGGLGDNLDGGNYGSIWVDFDNDRDMDLFIAKCRGGESLAAIDQMHRNNGDGTFTEIAASIGLANGFHQSWSSAWGDYDHDGDLDVVVGASSTAFGSHKVFRNDDGIFTDVTVGSGMENNTGTSTEWTTHDFNNDGWLDILGGGSVFMGTGPLTFEWATNAGNHAVGDLNNDGYLDLLSTNAVRYNNGGPNNWLRINPVGTVSNGNAIGTRIIVTTPLGQQIREIRSGDGFRYMSSLMAHFGLGQDTEITEVRLLWPSGLTTVLTDVEVNTTITVVESITTASTDLASDRLFSVYPNPATDRLSLAINAQEVVQHTVIDAMGRVVLQGRTVNMGIDISALAPGMYTIRLTGDGGERTARFTKE